MLYFVLVNLYCALVLASCGVLAVVSICAIVVPNVFLSWHWYVMCYFCEVEFRAVLLYRWVGDSCRYEMCV